VEKKKLDKKQFQHEKMLHKYKKIDEASGGQLFKKMQQLEESTKEKSLLNKKRISLKNDIQNLLSGKPISPA